MRTITTLPLLVAALTACSAQPPTDTADSDCCTVTLRLTVPEDVGPVYLTGNQDQLGPWRPDAHQVQGDGPERSAQFSVPSGTQFEYKFTLGTWDRQALGPLGGALPNFQAQVDGPLEIHHEIAGLKVDPETYMDDWQGSGVQGTLVYWKDVASNHLPLTHHVGIWLPPGYDASERYPVLYMHDGQNLFDPRLTGSGEIWDVDDAIVRLVDSGTIPPLIVVGVFNTADRGLEYSPWHGAPNYANFLIEELMPRVNESFSTLTGPDHTTVMGSSAGGLLSYFLVSNHPEVFGACGCISSHFPLSEAMVRNFSSPETAGETLDQTPFIVRDIEKGLRVPKGVRYWFDYGTEGLDAQYHEPHKAVHAWLLGQGLEEGKDFVIRSYEGAAHNEQSWRERLEDPLTFLFASGAEHRSD